MIHTLEHLNCRYDKEAPKYKGTGENFIFKQVPTGHFTQIAWAEAHQVSKEMRHHQKEL